MARKNLVSVIGLQFFAEGGAGAAGSGAGGGGTSAGTPTAEGSLATTSGAKNPLSTVKYGKQDDGDAGVAATQNTIAQTSQQIGVDPRVAKFESLIKGEYKDLYDQRVKDTIQNRLKSSKEIVDKYNSLAPALETLAKKYGVDASDVQKLAYAIDNDESYFEDEALERGISVEELKKIKHMERENADLKRQMAEQARRENADRLYSSWMSQADQLKSVYPSFDLEAELHNPDFAKLISNNVNVRTAYEVVHKDEIIAAGMQFAATETSRKVANSIMANRSRPVENGGSAPAVVKTDVSQLTKEDIAEINRRVARGEKIRF